MATGTIKNNKTWKKLGSVTGKTEMSLPSDYFELLCIGEAYLDNAFDFRFSLNLPKDDISEGSTGTTGKRYFTGFNGGDGAALMCVKVTSTKINMNECKAANRDVTNASAFRVYYR